jgi:hypothetical protein
VKIEKKAAEQAQLSGQANEAESESLKVIIKASSTSTLDSSLVIETDVSKSNSKKEDHDKIAEQEKKLAAVKLDEEQKIADAGNSGRVVLNHSTHCDGLMPVLARLKDLLPGSKITPGRISKGTNHCDEFELKPQRIGEEVTKTHKFVARKGYSIQDVMITIPNLNVEITQKFIRDKIAEAIANKKEQSERSTENDQTSLSANLNVAIFQARKNAWQKPHQEKSAQMTENAANAKHEKDVQKQIKKLQGKVPATQLRLFAERDVGIIKGKKGARTKNSM